MIANDIKKGMTIILDDKLYEVIDYYHTKPGKGGALLQTKLRRVLDGVNIEHTFRTQERVEQAFIERKQLEYLYRDGNQCYFMNPENYEQIPVEASRLKHIIPFLKENNTLDFTFHKGEIIDIRISESVALEVVKTEPGFKGNTATNVTKPATLETGHIVNCPIFINVGDKVKVDTRTGKYIERVS